MEAGSHAPRVAGGSGSGSGNSSSSNGATALADGSNGVVAGRTRPNLTYVGLIREAIVEAPEQRLYLREIYEAIADKYPFYRDSTSNTWKNVIRHCLSITPAFRNLPKEAHQPGKGGLWTIDDSIPDAYSRRRIRKSDHSKAGGSTAGSSSSKPRRRNTVSEGHSTSHAASASIAPPPMPVRHSEPSLAPADPSWSLDPPGSVGGSGDRSSFSDGHRPSAPSWMSPSSTYSSRSGGLFETSPSSHSTDSNLAPSPYSLPHSIAPQLSPSTDGNPYALPQAGHFEPGSTLGGASYGPPYFGLGGSSNFGGGMLPFAPLRSTHPHLQQQLLHQPPKTQQQQPSQTYSAPISPHYSPSLGPASPAAGTLSPFGQLQYPQSLQHQLVDSLTQQQQAAIGGAPNTSSGASGSSTTASSSSINLSDSAPSLGLSINQLHWRQLPSVEEQLQLHQQQTQHLPAYSWPPIPAALHPAALSGSTYSSNQSSTPLEGSGSNELIARPPILPRKAASDWTGLQSTEWDAGLRY